MATSKKARPLSTKVRLYMAKHPKATAKQVSQATGATENYVYVLKSAMKKKQAKAGAAPLLPVETVKAGGYEYEQKDGVWTNKGDEPATPVALFTSNASVQERIQAMRDGLDKLEVLSGGDADNVNHPAHYKVGGMETIDFIEAKQLSYHLGNVVKYITRADHKGNRKEDLLKARWYLNREIARLEA